MTQAIASKTSLYERDYLLWAEDTLAKLKARDFENLDIENLIEEIDDLGKSERKELKQRLKTLLEHLLKRIYIDMPQNYRGWEITIREQRLQIEIDIDDSPSLKNIWNESFNPAWRYALKKVRGDYPHLDFPDVWQFARDIDPMLNVDFWKT